MGFVKKTEFCLNSTLNPCTAFWLSFWSAHVVHEDAIFWTLSTHALIITMNTTMIITHIFFENSRKFSSMFENHRIFEDSRKMFGISREFPGISRIFVKSPENFREFSRIAKICENFRKFSRIFETSQISEHFGNFRKLRKFRNIAKPIRTQRAGKELPNGPYTRLWMGNRTAYCSSTGRKGASQWAVQQVVNESLICLLQFKGQVRGTAMCWSLGVKRPGKSMICTLITLLGSTPRSMCT